MVWSTSCGRWKWILMFGKICKFSSLFSKSKFPPMEIFLWYSHHADIFLDLSILHPIYRLSNSYEKYYNFPQYSFLMSWNLHFLNLMANIYDHAIHFFPLTPLFSKSPLVSFLISALCPRNFTNSWSIVAILI